MDNFIKAIKQIEDEGPSSEPRAVLQKIRRAAGLDGAFIKRFLGNAGGHLLNADLSVYIRTAVHHSLSEDNTETGVVLTSDGTTVALAPLLLGIESGFLSASRGSVRGLFELTFTKDLDLRSPLPTTLLGPDGCWDNITSPMDFTLLGSPALLTNAQLNGGMDGVVLGTEVKSRRHEKLSSLLREYYCHRLDSRGMDAAPRLISQRRRENFRALVSSPVLVRKVLKSVELQRNLTGRLRMGTKAKRQLRATVEQGIREFVHKYMGKMVFLSSLETQSETLVFFIFKVVLLFQLWITSFSDCPTIIPRCMWEAKPYRGTPTNLTLPLSHLFIHHTSTPSQPCLTIEQCAADMRSMQRFHQEDRGWDDIGYR